MTDEAAPETPSEAPAKPKMVRIPVKKVVDGTQARKDTSYSTADLSNAMQEQGPLRVHYGELWAEAERQVGDLKIKLEAAESAVYRQVRDELTVQKVKITEGLLDREVAAHRTILALKLAINEAKQVEKVAKAVYEAIDDKGKMLMGAGARERKEMDGEMRLNFASDRAAEQKDAAQRMQEARQRLAQ